MTADGSALSVPTRDISSGTTVSVVQVAAQSQSLPSHQSTFEVASGGHRCHVLDQEHLVRLASLSVKQDSSCS